MTDFTDEEFLALTPQERLWLHEQTKKKIWGEAYGKQSLVGMNVTKLSSHRPRTAEQQVKDEQDIIALRRILKSMD